MPHDHRFQTSFKHLDSAQDEKLDIRRRVGTQPISLLVGEMPGRAEGGAAAHSSAAEFAAPPPSVTFGDISPSRGEIRGVRRALRLHI